MNIFNRIKPSLESKYSLVASKFKKKKNYISLGLGEPNFPTSNKIIRSANLAMINGYTRYSSPFGLEELRKNRMPLADATVAVNNQDDLVKFILGERHREFASTGMRWFDMRRLYKDAKFNNLDRTKKFDAETFTLTDERLTLKIPPQILQYNPNMVDNP